MEQEEEETIPATPSPSSRDSKRLEPTTTPSLLLEKKQQQRRKKKKRITTTTTKRRTTANESASASASSSSSSANPLHLRIDITAAAASSASLSDQEEMELTEMGATKGAMLAFSYRDSSRSVEPDESLSTSITTSNASSDVSISAMASVNGFVHARFHEPRKVKVKNRPSKIPTSASPSSESTAVADTTTSSGTVFGKLDRRFADEEGEAGILRMFCPRLTKKKRQQEYREITIGSGLPSTSSSSAAEMPWRAISSSKTAEPVTSFTNNSISTTKYSPVTFLPLFFFEQFGRASNFFFLFCACLVLVPGAAVIPPAIAIIPLLIVLAITAIKEIVEDLARYHADRVANQLEVVAFRNGSFQTIRWRDVVVGDTLRFHEKQQICADIALLSTSLPGHLCFIQTANLDGETNLKIRQAPKESARFQDDATLAQLNGLLQCDAPNNNLYSFEGTLHLSEADSVRSVSLGLTNVVLRGSVVANTEWIIGVVLYTGHQSKLMLNAHAAPIKLTRVQHLLNRQVFFLFLIILISALIMITGLLYDQKIHYGNADFWYLPQSVSTSHENFIQFISAILLLQNLVPIGLFLQLEVSRYVQGWFISMDKDMYCEEKKLYTKARTTNLNEELGQITHMFTDKTGTLTQNKMSFSRCTIGYVQYGDTPGDDPFRTLEFDTTALLADLHGDNLVLSEKIHTFLVNIALCNTTIPQACVPGKDSDETIKYQSASPDETALVKAARSMGYVFCGRSPTSMELKINGVAYTYELLQVNDFTSSRKRMSVICETPDGRIMLYCKGADSMILDRIRHDTDAALLSETEKSLNLYSSYGLRTLCLAERELTASEYTEWEKLFHAASTSLSDRTTQLEKVAEIIERDMDLIGVTAIEDKLQDDVPETIATLLAADIRIWVLTGDKQETAVNIGVSCNLVPTRKEIIYCNGSSKRLHEILDEQLAIIEEGKFSPRTSLVINGTSLVDALSEDMKIKFLTVAIACRTLICCRVSPLQKAKVVNLVKQNTTAVTLAIGDGSNDVSMIQSASVGIGIQGEEGNQAARSADYAIGQFRFLKRLLLLHGSWSYHRQSTLIFYQFYIQVVFNFCVLYFQTVNLFSAQIMFQSLLQTLFFTLFTGGPIVIAAVFDRDVSETNIFAYPEVYTRNTKFNKLTIRTFWLRIFLAAVHSIVLFLFCYFAFLPDPQSLWVFGNVVYICIMLTLTLQYIHEVVRITIVDAVILLLSLAAFFLCQYVVSTTPGFFEYLGILHQTATTPSGWLLYLLVPMTLSLITLTWKYILAVYLPDDTQILNEIDFVHSDTKARQSIVNLLSKLRIRPKLSSLVGTAEESAPSSPATHHYRRARRHIFSSFDFSAPDIPADVQYRTSELMSTSLENMAPSPGVPPAMALRKSFWRKSSPVASRKKRSISPIEETANANSESSPSHATQWNS